MKSTKERVSEIRQTLKSEFKGYKFSVTISNYNGVDIYILNAPYEMTSKKYEQVNCYHINSFYDGKVKEDLLKINEIASEGVTYRETGDYGYQPNFYVNISIGKWDKEFKVN